MEDIRQRRKSTKDKADCELKKDHSDKKVFKSLPLTGASSIPPDVSNTQSSVSNVKGVRHGSKRNVAEKNYSLENKTNQVDFPFASSSPSKVSSSSTKVAPQIGKAASSPIKSVEDKSDIQVNGNTNVEALDSLALEGKNRVNKSAGSVEERNSPCHASCVINSPAKNVNAYPDLRMSLSTLKADLADIKRKDNDVSSFKVQHMKVKPTIDPVNLDHMAPNLTSAVPESRCIWRGTFSLEKSGKLPTDCYGVQAHLSTRASSKIADLVLKFSDELLLKEVPRLHTWPIQFQKKNPNEQDIALYFFAQDLCSYERSYRMLLEGMSINDIALEANFGGFQLLVFPSSLLPARSQRWNSLPFLWGVFRMKNFDDSHVPDLNAVTVNQGVSSPATCGSQSKFVSALLSGGSFALRSSYSSMHGPESAKPLALPSSAVVMSGEQSIEHELPPLKKHIATLKYHDSQADGITSVRDWSKEVSGRGLHSYDLQKDNTFSDNDIKSPMKTDLIPCGQLAREHTTAIGFRSDANYKDMSFTASKLRQGHDVFSGHSFSLDSGPSGSSDGGECAKSAVELQIEPSENPRRYNTLNLNHCLDDRSGSEELDLDLALGFPSKSEYEPENSLNDGTDQDGDVSLVLSLGMPCSTS
uniref:AIPP2-like SPOC-like domain-containing protein n=2 Tax=Chenopodium quinoa TaxID=63459 RepID=A0A803L5Z7_CHEQI